MSARDFGNGRKYELGLISSWLKESLKDVQQELELARAEEARTEEALDSMERKYWEGQEDALSGYLERITTRLTEDN